jgi:C_GCAxxG_C_C family probable redox protein
MKDKMSKTEQAVSCFEAGFNCAQAVLSAYAAEFGLEPTMALKVAGAFGGGMGRLAQTCGAVTGAFMVIGLKYGKVGVDDDEEQTKEKAYGLVQELAARFASRHGSIACKELLGCDIGTPEGRLHAKEAGLSATLCPKFVRDAAEIVGQLLELA